jgi:hypothetical protein
MGVFPPLAKVTTMPRTAASPQATNPSLVDDIEAFTIQEFCRRHSICRASFYSMRANGTGPKEKRAMGRVLISRKAAREWLEGAAA